MITDKSGTLPPIMTGHLAGIDVGGTKVWVADTLEHTVKKYRTREHRSMESVLEDYFIKVGSRPSRIVIGMAGARSDSTGEVSLTNADWPVFYPEEASKKYGIEISTANDLVVTAAGMLVEPPLNLLKIKPGRVVEKGAKLVVSISTGIGAAAAVWDEMAGRYVVMPGEGGHISFQPKNEYENDYLRYLSKKYTHVSIERALSGKHGLDNLIDHSLMNLPGDDIEAAIHRARKAGRPVGAVLLEYALQGSGTGRQTAQTILGRLGAMIGSALRDLTVVYKATGGVYLTGSVALALAEYLAVETDMIDRIVHTGAVHEEWIEKLPVFLMTNPDVAAAGALKMAVDLKEGPPPQ